MKKNKLDLIIENRSDLVIVGLTGRTGSGCSKAAELLSQSSKKSFAIPAPNEGGPSTENDIRKARIVSTYGKKNWQAFEVIRVRDIITSSILNESFESLCNFLKTIESDIDFEKKLKSVSRDFNALNKERQALHKLVNHEYDEAVHSFYWGNNKLTIFTQKLKNILTSIAPDKDLYTTLYQQVGNNLRSSSEPYNYFHKDNIENVGQIASTIEDLIKILRNKSKGKTFIAIDSLRNPFEILYLQERFSSFHCMSINTENDTRLRRLHVNLNDEQIHALDQQEYPKKFRKQSLNSQDVQKCIEISDIHCNNPQDESGVGKVLNFQLYYYVSLMMKPGLVSPSDEERIMQMAYTAKLNSGCISRQVGAAVSDSDYSVKAIGWNNTPQGHVPCSLRSVNNLIDGEDNDAFSHYERNDKPYRDFVEEIYVTDEVKKHREAGNNISYCFKQLQNNITGQENQVHTRSLHAEENAFLQISKYGGQGIRDGILFSTASPCELCSKKAYQLGIQKIVYIDPYPGIAKSHILDGGKEEDNPAFKLYSGAIGRSYFKLYNPIFSQKEELKHACNLQLMSPKREVELLKDKVRSLQEKISELEVND